MQKKVYCPDCWENRQELFKPTILKSRYTEPYFFDCVKCAEYSGLSSSTGFIRYLLTEECVRRRLKEKATKLDKMKREIRDKL